MSEKKTLNLIQFKSGDIGLSTGDGWFSKAILAVTSAWTGDAKVNHAYALVGENLVVEALGKIKENPISRYNNIRTEIWRLPIPDEERKAFREGMLARVNGAYGWLKYPGFLLDAGVTTVKRWFGMKNPCFFFSSTLGFSNIPVCSQLVVWGIHKYTSYRFKDNGKDVDWRDVNPDRLQDLLLLDSANKVIYSSL